MEDDRSIKIFKMYVGCIILFFIVGGIVTAIQEANQSRVETEAIKAGLHQEVIDGQKVWVQ